jgi:hypothetical protein
MNVCMYVWPDHFWHTPLLELGHWCGVSNIAYLTSLSPCVQDTGEDRKTTQRHGSAKAHIEECDEA